MSDLNNISRWQKELADAPASAVIEWASQEFGDKLTLASSLGAEDQVLTHMAARLDPSLSVFVLDTGRHFRETYELLDATRDRYRLPIRVYFPNNELVEEMVNRHGPNLFFESVDMRKRCCYVRKVEPLRRALNGKRAWITGLRRDQASSREEIRPVEWDADNGLVKINPLWDWSSEQVFELLRKHHVPYNRLHDQGFPSIGCAPCTRAVSHGDDPRSGRWWWESADQKECGLHLTTISPRPNGRAPASPALS